MALARHILFSLFLGALALPLKAVELEDYSASYKTLKTVYPDLEKLMTLETREAFTRFVGYLERIGGKDSLEQELLARLLVRLKRQSDTDLPWFTSHNAGHSLRVLQKMQKIMLENPEYLNWIYHRYDLQGYTQKKEVAMFLGSFIALVHDTGYSEFSNLEGGDVRKTPKYAHAELGAGVIFKFFYGILDQLLPGPSEKRRELKRAIYYAVLLHNADDARSSHITSKAKIQERREFYGTAKIYYKAVAREEPYLVLIRFADNLDFSQDRLFAHQKSELYLRLLSSIQGLDRSGSKRGDNTWVDTLRTHYLDQLQSPGVSQKFSKSGEYALLRAELEGGHAPDYPKTRLSLLTTSLLSALPGDFPHIYSNYIVDFVHYQRGGGGRNRVYVEFGEDVLEITPLERNYQIKRMAEALTSCDLVAARLVDLIYIRSPSLAAGRDIPLSVFSQLSRSDRDLRLIENPDETQP